MKNKIIFGVCLAVAAVVGNAGAYWVHPFVGDVLSKQERDNVEAFIGMCIMQMQASPRRSPGV